METVLGVLALNDGDMIQFGKNCGRDGVLHEPVRCYIRFLQTSPSQAARSCTSRMHAFALDDDVLDCESDIISIDAETFHRSPQRESSLAPCSFIRPTQATVVDFSGDDNSEHRDSALAPSFKVNDQELPGMVHAPSSPCSDPEQESDDSESLISSLESERRFELFSPIPEHHDVVQVARQEQDLPDDGHEDTSTGPTLSEEAEATSEPDSAQQKRKLDEIGFDDHSATGPDEASQKSETGLSSDDGSSCDDSSSVSDASSSCTSTPDSPPTAKKRRIAVSEEHLQDDVGSPRQAWPRRKAIRALVAKAVYTTGILTVGFFAGSLFTFKSMMNAAAAANASGSGPQ